MKVKIETKRILIGVNILEYYPYYFSIWKARTKSDPRPVVKKVIAQWASALTALRSGLYKAVYLPYSLSDQVCNYLKAELNGSDIVFTNFMGRGDGYNMNLDDLSKEMYSEPVIVMSRVEPWHGRKVGFDPHLFGRYDSEKIIQALYNAEISDD